MLFSALLTFSMMSISPVALVGPGAGLSSPKSPGGVSIGHFLIV